MTSKHLLALEIHIDCKKFEIHKQSSELFEGESFLGLTIYRFLSDRWNQSRADHCYISYYTIENLSNSIAAYEESSIQDVDIHHFITEIKKAKTGKRSRLFPSNINGSSGRTVLAMLMGSFKSLSETLTEKSTN